MNSPQAWKTCARLASWLEVCRTSLWSSKRAAGPWVRRTMTDMSSRSVEPDREFGERAWHTVGAQLMLAFSAPLEGEDGETTLPA